MALYLRVTLLRTQWFTKCYGKVLKSSAAVLPQEETVAESKGHDKLLNTASATKHQEPSTPFTSIITNPYLSDQAKPVVSSNEQGSIPFDEIPGPVSLRLISKFWENIPVASNAATVNVVQYLFSYGKLFGGILTWGGNSQFFKKFFDVYGSVVRLHGAFGSDIVLLSRPEHASQIFQSEGPYPIRSCLNSVEKYRLECRKFRQAGPFSMYGPDWEKIRKTAEQSLKTTMSNQDQKIGDICDEFIQRILVVRNKQEEVPNNFRIEIFKWSLECLSSVTLGTKLGFLDVSGLSPAADPAKLLNGLLSATEAIRKCEYGFHLWKFIQTPSWKSLVRNCDIVDGILAKYLDQTKHGLNEKKTEGLNLNSMSLLEHLILQNRMDEEDVMTILLDMYLIGANAMTHSVSFLFYHLAKNPRCQIKLYEEMKKAGSQVGQDTLRKLKYLDACIKESLRLNPPIPILSRVLNKDVIINQYHIPKGTNVLFAAHLNSQCEEYFEDAHKFKPERWLANEFGGFGNEYQSFASMPFGHGPKSCLVKEMALTKIALVLFKICQKFRIEYNYADIKSSNELLASPTKPLKFRFIDRE